MRFLLLVVNFFIQGFKKIFPLILFNPGRGYTLKKKFLRLVDNEIFLTHWAKLCLILCDKCIVIYYKIVGEGLPSNRSFRRLVANNTKSISLKGSLKGRGILLKKFSSSRWQEDKETFFWGYTTGGTLKKSSCCLVANETKRYSFVDYVKVELRLFMISLCL